MKTKKRFFTLMLALALAVCMAVPAFASNEDSNFMIPIASNYTWGANEVSVRKKDQCLCQLQYPDQPQSDCCPY